MGAMRVLLATQGSFGDVKPFAVLARALADAGHRVVALTTPVYGDLFRAAGADFRAAGPPLGETPAEAQAFTQSLRRASPRRQVELVVAHLQLRDPAGLYGAVAAAADDCDVAVCHSAAFVAQQAVTARGLPWASFFFYPGAVAAADRPPLDLPDLGRLGNRWLRGAVAAYLRPCERRIEAVLRRLDGRSRRVRLVGCHSPHLDLLAFSRHLGPLGERLPPRALVTGPWLERREGYEPPAALAQFLGSERPRVAVGFGSMGGQEGAATAATVVAAVERSGSVAVIQRGWAGLDLAAPPDSVCFADYVPHDYLFPRVDVVVHHGGAGTVAAACLAGAVSVVVPHAGDQAAWGRRLHALGVAPPPIPRRRLDALGLAAALVAARDERLRRRARELATAMATEPGVAAAVTALEELAGATAPLRAPRAVAAPVAESGRSSAA